MHGNKKARGPNRLSWQTYQPLYFRYSYILHILGKLLHILSQFWPILQLNYTFWQWFGSILHILAHFYILKNTRFFDDDFTKLGLGVGTSVDNIDTKFARFLIVDKNKWFYFKILKNIAILCINYSVNCVNNSQKNNISRGFISSLK